MSLLSGLNLDSKQMMGLLNLFAVFQDQVEVQSLIPLTGGPFEGRIR